MAPVVPAEPVAAEACRIIRPMLAPGVLAVNTAVAAAPVVKTIGPMVLVVPVASMEEAAAVVQAEQVALMAARVALTPLAQRASR